MFAKKRVGLGASLRNQDDSQVKQTKNIFIDFSLHSRRDDPRPYLDVRIFGKRIRALLDSGASHTVLGQKGMWMLEKFPIQVKPTPNRWVETADSEKHSIQGSIIAQITLEDRTRNFEIFIVPSLSQSLILGIDFWEEMQLVTDISNKTWEFAPSKLRIASLEGLQGIRGEDHLTEDEAAKLQAFIGTEFDENSTALGRTTLVEHVIDTGNAQPIKQRYYPLSPARLQIVHEELDKMLKLGVVVPSKSAWSSPIVLLDKPDGSKRFCIDFRKVNMVTKRDAYPLPQVTVILDRLRDARYLSSLDIKSAYWQIPLSKDSREKTAFTVPGRGLYEFTTMPFGLHNAPATWQRFIDSVIGADLEPYVFVYLDDVLVVTKTFDHHLEILKEIFRRLKSANVTLNKDKCHLCRSELKYLGYVVDQRGLKVDPEKIEAIIKIPVPTTQKQVRQFCGTASWYRRFIPDFASRLYPLTNMLKKNCKFVWNEEAQQAFENIRSCLVKAPILTCPDFSKEFVISCDASGVGVGAVLGQQGDKGEQVIAYASRTLSRAEQKYSATERECLAVIWAVERFRPYVEGTHFTVITDHYSLLWLHNLKDPQGRLARWALRLQPYSFTLIHRKGTEHAVPDLLSRSVEPENVRVAPIQQHQPDKWYSKLIEEVSSNGGRYPLWRVDEGKLFKLVLGPNRRLRTSSEWKEVVPKQERSTVLSRLHDEPTAGHLGVQKTLYRVQEHYYWPKMRQDISKYVSHCRTCQQTKDGNLKPTGFMGGRRGVDVPWQMIAADLLGPFPRSSAGYKYLLVVTDVFTKYPLLYPIRAATSSIVAKHLETGFVHWGIPKYLICDNGPEFSGSQVKKLASQYKVKLLYNASRHPQANPTERVNKTLGNMLRAYVGGNHRDWDKEIPKIGFALRSAKHESTTYTPAYLNFGREMNLNLQEETATCDKIPEVESSSEYGEKLEELQEIYKEVQEKLTQSHHKNAERYNLRRRPLSFKVNDKVWKRNFPMSDAVKGFCAKLAPKFTGPFIIRKKVSPLIYQLQDEDGKIMGNWHVSDLKAYNQSEKI